LDVILDLVGTLDDSPGDDTACERFRNYLEREIEDVGHARDLIEECLRESGPQYPRALQDLVNYVGHFLGFEVEHGRYQGVPGEIGHDGLWTSPTGFHVVIETKTTEQFHIKTSALTGYVNELISEQQISDWGNAMGLYVIGDPDPEVQQLRNAIVAENKTDQLRTISIDALLSLAELLSEYDVSHEDALAVLRPSGPSIDPIANLMARIVAQEQGRQSLESLQEDEPEHEERTSTVSEPEPQLPVDGEPSYWLTPVSGKEGMTPEDVVYRLVGQDQIYGYGKRTPGRKDLSPGDRLAFYASGDGVVAHAVVASSPEKKANPEDHLATPDAQDYPYIFQLRNPTLYLDEPVVIDESLRGRLEAFEGRDLSKSWSWFVQSSREVSEHDFDMLTR
jgi:hypothetical protein